jgi:hypothetical protein
MSKVTVNGRSYEVYIASLSGDGAEVKVIAPDRSEHWQHWFDDDVVGLFDGEGDLWPAAEDKLCKDSAESVDAELHKNKD